MWKRITERLKDYPERLNVARVLVENGLSVRNGKIWLNEIAIPAIRIAKVANVDRRTVNQTIKIIEEDEVLREIFKSIRSAGPSLRETARYLNFGVVEITPTDAKMPGILAQAASLIAEKGISIRQAIVDDPELSPTPRLTLITENKIPGDLIPKFLRIEGVSKVSVY